MYHLDNKIVLVTGAGSGIGRETAYAFGRENVRLILFDKNEIGLETTANDLMSIGSVARAFTVDVTRESQVKAAVETVISEFGVIDILVNCAGVSTMQWSWDITEAEWDLNMDVNAKGCWLVCKHVLPHILAFITVWTSLMFPLALAYSNAQTIISSFKGYGSFNWPVMAAASLIVTIPQIILFSFCNKYLISGYTLGAVKE